MRTRQRDTNLSDGNTADGKMSFVSILTGKCLYYSKMKSFSIIFQTLKNVWDIPGLSIGIITMVDLVYTIIYFEWQVQRHIFSLFWQTPSIELHHFKMPNHKFSNLFETPTYRKWKQEIVKQVLNLITAAEYFNLRCMYFFFLC